MSSNNDAKANGAGGRTTRLSVAANGCSGECNHLNFSVPPCLCGEKDCK
jgi:hypothetical protein